VYSDASSIERLALSRSIKPIFIGLNDFLSASQFNFAFLIYL
jgi:hypothetical protein